MELSIPLLVDEHRRIEAEVELFAEGVAQGAVNLEAFGRVRELCIRHFEREEAFLVRLDAEDAALASKLREQHNEALELAGRADEAAAACQAADLVYLARRFLAIVQHNMIEEERDVFPFSADR